MDEIVEQYYKLFMKVLGNDQVAYPVYSWSNYIRRCLYKIVGLNRAGVFNESFVNYLSVNSCTLKMSLEAFCDGTESDYFKEVYNYFDSSYAVFSNYYDKETGLDSCDFPFIKTLSDQMREVIIKSGLNVLLL